MKNKSIIKKVLISVSGLLIISLICCLFYVASDTKSNLVNAADAATLDEIKIEAASTESSETKFVPDETQAPPTQSEINILEEKEIQEDISEGYDVVAPVAEVEYETTAKNTEEHYNTGYVLATNNPDYTYIGSSIPLSDSDRELVERIVMGETGYAGYNSMLLVAQCIRDAYVKEGYTSIQQVKDAYGYCGRTDIAPSQSCKDAISYIFDQGGSAVQHRILFYYASDYCESAWHESQNFICQEGYQRFFDAW